MNNKILLAAILAAFSSAATSADENLPDLGGESSSVSVKPSKTGISASANDSDSRFSVSVQQSQQSKIGAGVNFSKAISGFAIGGGALVGDSLSEAYLSTGLQLSKRQQLLLSGGFQNQAMSFNYTNSNSVLNRDVTQNSGQISYSVSDLWFIDFIEAAGYKSQSKSSTNDLTYTIEKTSTIETWNDPRRVAGATLSGGQVKLGISPWTGGQFVIGGGKETLTWDMLVSSVLDTTESSTSSVSFTQNIFDKAQIRLSGAKGAAQITQSAGVGYAFEGGSTLNIDVIKTTGQNGVMDDQRTIVALSIPMDKGAKRQKFSSKGAADSSLLDRTFARPTKMPSVVMAKVDTTAKPTLVSVKNIGGGALPAAIYPFIYSNSWSIVPGDVLIADYAFYSPAGTAEGASTYQWYKDGVAITGATSATYTVTEADVGSAISLSITPIDVNGLKGTTVSSGNSVIVSATPAPLLPQAISPTVVLLSSPNGQIVTGATLLASYSFQYIVAEGASTYQWYKDGVAIAGATSATYTVQAGDAVGGVLSVAITPIAATGEVGATVTSSGVTIVAAPNPISNVLLQNWTGATWSTDPSLVPLVGQNIAVNYNGSDPGLTIQWYKDGVAIPGANLSLYTISAGDYGSVLSAGITVPGFSEIVTGNSNPVSAAAGSIDYIFIDPPHVGVQSVPAIGASGSTIGMTYQWYKDGVAIPGATSHGYTPVAGDVGSSLALGVTLPGQSEFRSGNSAAVQ